MKTLPIQDVRAIGRKFLGDLGSSSAFFFPRSLNTPTFQAVGTSFTAQHVLNRWSSADIREGHFFNTRYGIWSRGLGHDTDFDLESTRVTSSTVNAAVSIWTKGAGASGIHDGLSKVLGTEEYTSVK